MIVIGFSSSSLTRELVSMIRLIESVIAGASSQLGGWAGRSPVCILVDLYPCNRIIDIIQHLLELPAG
jgi:hypothetical protein